MPDIVTGKIFVDGERGITATKMNQIISQAVIQPDFVTTKPSSSTLDPTDQLIEVKSTGAYARITGQQLSDSVAGSPSITAMRLRSFNAIGNPNFEVDQINIHAGLTNPASGVRLVDRWTLLKAGTMTVNAANPTLSTPLVVPGTNFAISAAQLGLTLTAAEASLGATDILYLGHNIEGCQWRELANDVTSLSLLVYSSVAPLKFSVGLRSPDNTQSLVKLCTISTAGTWTLIPLPNIPKPTSGNFSMLPGVLGCLLSVTLACGSTNIAPAADIWQSGQFFGAPGMDNWCSKPINTTSFYLGFIQHEPGPLCTTLMDCPFEHNLRSTQRYFAKSYLYGTAIGTASQPAGMVNASLASPTTNNIAIGNLAFPAPMAKAPAVTVRGNDGSANNATVIGGSNVAVSSIGGISEKGFNSIIVPAGQTPVGLAYTFHYIADTGW